MKIMTSSDANNFADKLNYAEKNYTAAQVIKWLTGANINGAGKFIFVEEAAKTEKYPGSKLTFYIIYDGDKMRRCGKLFAEDMIAVGKGVYDGTSEEFHARRGR